MRKKKRRILKIGFASFFSQLPDRTTQRTKSGKTVAEIIPCYYRYYNKIKVLCKGEKGKFIPVEKIPTQREWQKYLNQSQKTNPILEGFKYLKYLEESPCLTYKEIAEKFDISKARVSQMTALVKKLPKEILDFLADKNDPEYFCYFTERRLRPLTQIKNPELQKEKFGELLRLYHY